MIEKKLTEQDYNLYIRQVYKWIMTTEERMERLENFKKIAQLSFEDWVKFQNGKLKIKDVN